MLIDVAFGKDKSFFSVINYDIMSNVSDLAYAVSFCMSTIIFNNPIRLLTINAIIKTRWLEKMEKGTHQDSSLL